MMAALASTGCDGVIGAPAAGGPAGPSGGDPAAVTDPADPESSSVPESPLDPLHKRWLEDTGDDNPLRRLTMGQLRYSIEDLTGVEVEETVLPTEAHRDGFVTFASLQVSGESDVRAFAQLAQTVASSVELPRIVSCDVYDEACLGALLDGFGKRTFRRPLTSDERARYEAVFAAAQPLGGEQAVRYVIRGLLSSPNFLYRTQSFADEEGETGYAMAEKLSYFLWSSVPDAALFDAAEAGRLDSPEGRRAAAARMLEDARARRTIDAFHRQWLRLDELAQLSPDAEKFPEFSPSLPRAYEEAMLRFARDTFFRDGGGTFEELLTARRSYVDDELASLYGYPAPADGFAEVGTTSEPRAGILMQGGFFARLSTLKRSEPIYRGAFILEQVLCRELELPGDLNVSLPERDPSLSYREQIEEMTAAPFCNNCHSRINPLGFALDSFDALGRHRPEEDGAPVDTAVELAGAGDLDGTYANGPELMSAIGRSDMAAECYAEKWFELALGRARRPDSDQATFEGIMTAFDGTDRQLQELLLAIVESDAF
jgi:hypothetical protein